MQISFSQKPFLNHTIPWTISTTSISSHESLLWMNSTIEQLKDPLRNNQNLYNGQK